ncbi:unnamed protein product, partial [Chrysoparadoxa australica]
MSPSQGMNALKGRSSSSNSLLNLQEGDSGDSYSVESRAQSISRRPSRSTKELRIPPRDPPLPHKPEVLMVEPNTGMLVNLLSRTSSSSRGMLAISSHNDSVEASSSSQSESVVGPSPYHVDQLFNMLDLSLDQERMGKGRRRKLSQGSVDSAATAASAKGTGDEGEQPQSMWKGWDSVVDFNASVWHILQVLPVHGGMVKELRTLQRANHQSWSALLDPVSEYKMLYLLSIIDAFCTSKANLETLPAVLNWTLKFALEGGVEHLIASLTFMCAQVRDNERLEAMTDPSKLEARTLCIAFMCRLLHHFAQLDPAYLKCCDSEFQWPVATLHHQYLQDASGSPTYEGTELRGGLLALSEASVDIITSVMDVLLALVRQYAAAGPLESAVFDGMRLVACCAVGTAGGYEAVSKYEQLEAWLTVMCIRSPSSNVRRTACALLYKICEVQPPDSGQPLEQALLTCLVPIFCRLEARVWSSGSSSAAGDTNAAPSSSHHATSSVGGTEPSRIAKGPGGAMPSERSSEGSQRQRKAIVVPIDHLSQVNALIGGLLHLGLYHPRQGGVETRRDEQHRTILTEVVKRLKHHNFAASSPASAPDYPLIGLLRILVLLVESSIERRKLAMVAWERGNQADRDVSNKAANSSPSLL